MKNTKNIFKKINDNILTILAGFLIVVIPLYPKIPIADLIEGYIVRLRFEDIAVLVTFLIWLFKLARKKVKLPQNKITYAIYAYIVVGFLSSLSAIVITKTVPPITSHILKLFFHLARRIEYFSLYFITYSSIRNKKDLKLFIKVVVGTLLGVVVYGLGQKYLYWPAFSTMNREFSKGVKLYLQPNTRLFSTFAGHYDLAAYLMIMLGFLIPAVWLIKNKKLALFLSILSLFSYWSLVLTTSRTSFIGYLAAVSLTALLLLKNKKFFWVFKRWFVVMFFSAVVMFFFSDLLERFIHVIPDKETRDTITAIQQSVHQPFVSKPNDGDNVSELPSLLGFLFRGEQATVIDDVTPTELERVASKSDVPPTTVKPTPEPELPADVTEESEEVRRQQASDAGEVYEGPSYSENALKYGLSLGIRLDVLWPQAIEGFKRNPVLGSGYSTLVKENLTHFTYAESTDNDYLRMLGETGILGALTFMAILYFTVFYAHRLYKNSSDTQTQIIALGMIASTIALMINALYIDIYESSKVAYTYWMLIALFVRTYELKMKDKEL